MAELTGKLRKAWENREGPVVFTTVNDEGIPNAIYASCVSLYDDETILVANNYFHKTLENIKTGSAGSILFITGDDTSYQFKGTIEYHTEGDLFEDMKTWNPSHRPGHAAAVLRIEQVYSGAEQLA